MLITRRGYKLARLYFHHAWCLQLWCHEQARDLLRHGRVREGAWDLCHPPETLLTLPSPGPLAQSSAMTPRKAASK